MWSKPGCALAVRLIPKGPLDEPVTGAFLIDQLPESIPLWDPYEFSSLAQAQDVLHHLAAARSILLLEVGHSARNEGSTLEPRPQVEGDDALGWYLFGSGQNMGLVSLMVDRSCANGGVSWVSMFAVDESSGFDLLAPFLSASSDRVAGASSQQRRPRHDPWTQAMMFYTAKEWNAFVRTHVLASPSLQQRRHRLSFVVTVSNSAGEQLTVIVGNERHQELLVNMFVERRNQVRSEWDPTGNSISAGGGSSANSASSTKAMHDVLLRNPLRERGRGSIRMYVLRVYKSQRSDSLQLVALAETILKGQTTGSKKSKTEDTGAAAPPGREADVDFDQVSTASADSNDRVHVAQRVAQQRDTTLAALAKLEEAQRFQQQLDGLRDELKQLEDDTRVVVRSTESIVAEHRAVRTAIALCVEEKHSVEAAITAIKDRTREMERELASATSDAESWKRRAVSSSAATAKTVEARLHEDADEDRRQLRELDAKHEDRMRSLRAESEAALATVEAEYRSEAAEWERVAARASEDARQALHHVDENALLAERNVKKCEADVAEKTRRMQALVAQSDDLTVRLASFDRASAQLQKMEIHSKGASAEAAQLKDELREVNAELLLHSKLVENLERDVQKLAQQRTRDAAEAAAQRELSLGTLRRRNAMWKSAFLAAENSARTEIVAEWCEGLRELSSGIHTPMLKRFLSEQLSVAADATTQEIVEDLAKGQALEERLRSETQALEVEAQVLRKQLQQLMDQQEAEMARTAEVCNQAIARVDELRQLQKKKFAQREEEMKRLKGTYRTLMQEFVAQIEHEVEMARYQQQTRDKRIDSVASTPRPTAAASTTSLVGGGAATSSMVHDASHSLHVSRSDSLTPSLPSLSAPALVTASALKKHDEDLAIEDESLYDTCVRQYLLWSQEVAACRSVDAEISRIRLRISRTESAAAGVAESLAQERKRLADAETELDRLKRIEVEATEALQEFVAASNIQRSQMQKSLDNVTNESRDAFSKLAQAVEEHEDKLRKTRDCTAAVSADIAAVAKDLDALRPTNPELLAKQWEEAKRQTEVLEKRLDVLREKHRSDFGITSQSGFYSLDERTTRAMGIPSMRDPESVFAVPGSRRKAIEPLENALLSGSVRNRDWDTGVSQLSTVAASTSGELDNHRVSSSSVETLVPTPQLTTPLGSLSLDFATAGSDNTGIPSSMPPSSSDGASLPLRRTRSKSFTSR